MTTERHERVLTVAVNGRIERATVPVFEETIRTEIEETDRSLILDFAEVTYIDSAGLRLLLMMAKGLQARAVGMALCALSVPVRDVVSVTGFEAILPIHGTRIEALAETGG